MRWTIGLNAGQVDAPNSVSVHSTVTTRPRRNCIASKRTLQSSPVYTLLVLILDDATASRIRWSNVPLGCRSAAQGALDAEFVGYAAAEQQTKVKLQFVKLDATDANA